MSRQVCRYFLQGNCRFGDSCNYEHPGVTRSQNTNRFGALSNQTQSNAMAGQRVGDLPYSISKEALRKDLTDERPPWILSSFGPGKDAPEQLFGGYPREQSFEELRLHYNNAVAAGKSQDAINQINGLYQMAEQQIQNTLSNIDAAVQYVVDAGNKHPNRLDICKQNTLPGGTTGLFSKREQTGSPFSGGTGAFGGQSGAFAAAGQSLKPFGSTAQSTASAFGQPSALGQKPSPFGAPTFGQPSQPTGTSAFGQPSSLGGTGPNAFGQTSALGAKPSPFGAPTFGQPTQPTAAPTFGQPTQPSGTASAFGQPTALGVKPNPFGGASASTTSPFAALGGGQTNNAAAQNPFAKQGQATSPFGAPSTATTNTGSPFGQPPSAPANPFGNPTQTANPFANANGSAQPMDASSNVAPSSFGAPTTTAAANPFATATSAATPFGQPAASNSNPFGAPANPASAATPASPVGGSDPYAPNATRKHPPIESYSARNPDGRLRMFKGKAVVYGAPGGGSAGGATIPVPMTRNFDGSVARVWFPDGPPAFTPETELPEGGEYDTRSKELWAKFVETGRFVGGEMPLAPPRREWCVWDF